MAFGTCFVKGSISDGITQTKLEKQCDDNNNAILDYKRNMRFATWSGAYCGCIQHWVYNIFYGRLFPGTSILSRALCTAFDCTIHAPMFYFPSYYISKSLMTGGTANDGLNEYINNKWDILIPYWRIWIPTIFAVMFFIPFEFRVITIGLVSLFWLILLSYMVPMKDKDEDATQPQM